MVGSIEGNTGEVFIEILTTKEQGTSTIVQTGAVLAISDLGKSLASVFNVSQQSSQFNLAGILERCLVCGVLHLGTELGKLCHSL